MIEDTIITSLISNGPWTLLTFLILRYLSEKFTLVVEKNTTMLGRVDRRLENGNKQNKN